MRYLVGVGCVAAAAMALMAGPARADAIDGHWCRAESGRMTISGPSIVTPAGTETQGNYQRHAFSYVVPAGEPGAGLTIYMVLLNEDTVHLTRGNSTASSSPPEEWRRCPADVS